MPNCLQRTLEGLRSQFHWHRTSIHPGGELTNPHVTIPVHKVWRFVEKQAQV